MPIDLFKQNGIDASGGMLPPPMPKDVFKSSGVDPSPVKDQMPQWYPVASGAVGGRLTNFMPKVMGAGAALGSAIRGEDLPTSFVYDQAKQRAEMAAKNQAKEQPVWTAVGESIGEMPAMLAAGGAINKGLEGLGSAGRFLAGSPDVPLVSRAATGQFTSLNTLDNLYAEGIKFLSRGALGAREGAQAGILGALQGGGDIKDAALNGMTTGGAIGAFAQPVVQGLSQVSKLGEAALEHLPGWAKGIGGFVGAQQLVDHAPQILSSAASNPIATVSTVGTGMTLAASRYLAEHPEMLSLLTRLGVLGSGQVGGALSSPPTPQGATR